MSGYVVRPTRITAQGTVPRDSGSATEQRQSARVRPSVPTSAAVQQVGTSPSPAGRAATEDEGQRRVGGQRGLSRSSDNRPAGTVVSTPSEVLMERGVDTNVDALPPVEETQGASTRVTLNAHIDVRVTRDELDAIKRRARVLGVKPSQWSRAVLRDALDSRRHEVEALAAQAAVPRPSPELARAVEQLRRVGVNLNQVVRAGTAVDDDLLREVLAAVADVRAALGDEVSL